MGGRSRRLKSLDTVTERDLMEAMGKARNASSKA